MSFDFSQMNWKGGGLVRPECVLATNAGFLYVSDFRGGVTEIAPDGRQTFFGGQEVPGYGLLKPNGIALLENGSFLIAHLGDEVGGIFRITRDHKCTAFVTTVEAQTMPPSNFIYVDRQGRLWVTVSTRICPRSDAYRPDVDDGFIALIENGEARIVADGLGYTNELFVDPDGKSLYVNATFSRELIRFDIARNNTLRNKFVICNFGPGTFPDGLTRDKAGDFWITSIVSNRVIRVKPDGRQEVVLQDNDSAHIDWVEAAFQKGEMGRPHLDTIKSQCFKSISSLAFSGADLSTLNLGCLLDTRLPSIPSQQLLKEKVSGVEPAHWHFDNNRINHQ